VTKLPEAIALLRVSTLTVKGLRHTTVSEPTVTRIELGAQRLLIECHKALSRHLSFARFSLAVPNIANDLDRLICTFLVRPDGRFGLPAVGRHLVHTKMSHNLTIHKVLAMGEDTQNALHNDATEMEAVIDTSHSAINEKVICKDTRKLMFGDMGQILRRLHLNTSHITIRLLAYLMIMSPASAALIPGSVGAGGLAPVADENPVLEDIIGMMLADITTLIADVLMTLAKVFHQWCLGVSLALGVGSGFKKLTVKFRQEGRSIWFLWSILFFLFFLLYQALPDINGGIDR
jgi:hypothetical protein